MSKGLLQKAIDFVKSFNKGLYGNIEVLSQTVTALVAHSDDSRSDILKGIRDTLSTDLKIAQEIKDLLLADADLMKDSAYPFKYNQLATDFELALKFIDDNGASILNNGLQLSNFDELFSLGDPLTNGIVGTPNANAYQTFLLTALRVMDSTDLEVINPDTSPNFQTTKFSELFPLSSHPEIDNWFYHYRDSVSPDQGELLFPSLGYNLGGSRYDGRYLGKEFATQDCTSFLAKLLSCSTSITTLYMEKAHKGDLSGLSKSEKVIVESVLEVLTPVTYLADTQIGDVIMFRKAIGGGHTGIITNIDYETGYVEYLSTARNFERGVEGFGLLVNNVYNEIDKAFYFFTDQL